MPIEPPATPWAFPPPGEADDVGVVGVGADLEPGTLLAAYRAGLFPMPVDGGPRLAWWSPDPRGVIPLDGLRVSRSLRRACRQLRGPGRHRLRAGHRAVRRPGPRRRLDQPRRDRGLPTPARAGVGPQRRDVAGRRAGRRALRRVGRGRCSPASPCSTRPATPPRWRWSASSTACVAGGRHPARRAVDDAPPSLPGCRRHRPGRLPGPPRRGRHHRRGPLRLTRPRLVLASLVAAMTDLMDAGTGGQGDSEPAGMGPFRHANRTGALPRHA